MLTVSGSEAIRAIGYNPNTRVMWIEFNHGDENSRKYKFCGVPQEVFDGLLYAKSKGEYYGKNIRGKYLCYDEE